MIQVVQYTPFRTITMPSELVNVRIDKPGMILIFKDFKFSLCQVSVLKNAQTQNFVLESSQLDSNFTNCIIKRLSKQFAILSACGKCFLRTYKSKPHEWELNTVQGFYERSKEVAVNANQYQIEGQQSLQASFVYVAQSEAQPDSKKVYQINEATFLPLVNSFIMTAGSNGQINFWDFIQKNKIGYITFQRPVAYFDFNHTGDLVVFATGYDWSLGNDQLGKFLEPVGIRVKSLVQKELKHMGN